MSLKCQNYMMYIHGGSLPIYMLHMSSLALSCNQEHYTQMPVTTTPMPDPIYIYWVGHLSKSVKKWYINFLILTILNLVELVILVHYASILLMIFNSPYSKYQFLHMPFSLVCFQDISQKGIDWMLEMYDSHIGITDYVTVHVHKSRT